MTNQNKKESNTTQGSTVLPKVGAGLKQTTIGQPNNKTLNNQINNALRARTSFIETWPLVPLHGIPKASFGAKQKGQFPNQLSNANFVSQNYLPDQQKKYDLLMSVFDKNLRGPIYSSAERSKNISAGSTPQEQIKAGSGTQRVFLKARGASFLAYWLLPFLGLIPGNAFVQDKGLASANHYAQINCSAVVAPDANKLDKLALDTTLFSNKAIPNPEQEKGNLLSGPNKLVRFYLKELETNYINQTVLAQPGIKTNKVVTALNQKERSGGVTKSFDANLNFVLSMPLKRNSNFDMLSQICLSKDLAPQENNTLSNLNDSGQANPLWKSPRQRVNPESNAQQARKKATFKIRPNSSNAYVFSNKMGLCHPLRQDQMFLANQVLTNRAESLYLEKNQFSRSSASFSQVGALNSSPKSITLKSNYAPFSLETFTKGNLFSVRSSPGTEVAESYLHATKSQANFSLAPRRENKSQVLKNEDTFDLGLTFSNYLKYLKSRIALVAVEGQKYVGNRGFSKSSTNTNKTSLPGELRVAEDSFAPYRKQSKAPVGRNLVKTALVTKLLTPHPGGCQGLNNRIGQIYLSTTLNAPQSVKPERRLAKTQNTISIVLNHKKFNHISKIKIADRVSSTLANSSVEEELVYITKKKDLQKKHKAKKQRLESRRQKKRKRFYPRPTWLRLRLGLSMSDRRSDLAIRTNPTNLPYAELHLQEMSGTVDLQQRLSSTASLTSWAQRSTLSNAKGNKNKHIIRAEQRPSHKFVSGKDAKWQKTLNTTTYNQIVYNLIVSKNLLNTRFDSNSSNKPRSFSLQELPDFLEATNLLPNQTSNAGSGPSVSFYKLENKVLSDFIYRKKPPTELYPISSESRTQLKKLIQIKNHANYVNFERKSNNQTTPTKETNSSLFKDFWIWLYNITNRNSYNKTLLVDTVLNHLSVPINLSKQSPGILPFWSGSLGSSSRFVVMNSESNKKSLKLASWAFNQTNLLSSTNKRLNIWATLKLRNQSKNNKTKYIEKKLKKQLNNSLSPFVLKNLAKLEAHNQEYTDNKSNVNFGKLASRISNKIHQKEQKLAFISNMSSTLTKPRDASNITTMPSLHVKEILAAQRDPKTRLSSSSGRVNQIETKFMDNFSWWRYPPGFNTSSLPISNLDIPNSTVGTYPTDNFLLGNRSSFYGSAVGLLFHFCALISIISISQLRCFIKFHLILLHKLSNGYLQVLFKTSTIVQKYLHSSIMALSLLVSPSHNRGFRKGKTNIVGRVAFKQTLRSNKITGSNGQEKPNNAFVAASMNPVKQGSSALLNKRAFQNRSFLSLFEKLKKVNHQLWQERKSSKDLTGAHKTGSSLASKNKVIISTFKKELNVSAPRVTLNKADFANKANVISNSPKSAAFKQGSGNQTFRKVLFDKPFKSSVLNLLGLASTDKAISNPLTGVYGNSTVATLNISSQKDYSELVLKNLQILQISKQISAWRYTKETLNSVKKDTLNTGFKVVDTFESFLRIIYGIFEKPYEFTMDWIAYAFLVEWSSDVLSYTPQNHSAGGAQAKNWSTFAKLVNQNQLNLLFYTKQLVAASAMTTKYNMPSQNLALLGLSTVAFSQFLTKRILYLNDFFLTVLYRPDTDLIVRQRKGTLFWDIWSDFLLKAADKYNINVPSLSNVKEEQNVLLENFLSDSTLISQNTAVQGSYSRLSKTPRVYGLNRFNVEQTTPGSNLLKNKFNGIFGTTKALVQSNNTSFASKSSGLDYLDLAQQSITYQSKETDLFLEYHPPKSFSHISAIKYYSLVQQPIGSLVCQIYSGILEKQIAKNVLVIGSTLSSNSASSGSAAGFESMQKTLLIQALAGETEMKMITDNASRYAVVSRGFAVGIKHLKEVFEAITLNTPCLFLLEDIHLIGERRPQLISDHGDAFDSSKSADANFGWGGAAVHEKNQISYQLSRHSLADYKKPFKGDFSLAIPSNHFSFDFFLKSSSNTNGPFANFSSIVTHPLANSSSGGTQSIFDGDHGDHSGKQDSKSSLAVMNKKLTSKRNLSSLGQDALGSSQRVLSTSLQLNTTKNSLLSPPSTSPFSVLLLKEQKKLKAKKIVKELPWIGLSSGAGGAQQVALLPRVSYSVRAKVSALAELGFSSMSAKLDMITDLLVIIDSVRGHRGFVVFATTHLPHILDPALRRPGRLDETISIPTLSNLWTRWEFSKTSLNPITSNSKQRLLDTSGYISNKPLGLSYKGTLDTTDFINLDFLSAWPSGPRHGDPALRTGTRALLTPEGRNQNSTLGPKVGLPNLVPTSSAESYQKQNFSLNKAERRDLEPYKDRIFVANKQKYITKLRHVAYYQMGKKLFSSATKFERAKNAERGLAGVPPFNLSSFSPVYLNPTTYESVSTLTETSEFILHYGPEALKYKSLYMSPNKGAADNRNSQSFGINNILVTLMGGKFTEFFASTSVPGTLLKDSNTNKSAGTMVSRNNKADNAAPLGTQQKTLMAGFLDTNKPFISNPELTKNLIKANFISLYGIDQTWRAATSFTLSFVQKRYLFNKNLVVPKLLNFLNFGPLEEAPSPPASNILVPAKRFENAKKGFKETIQNKLYGISTSLIQDKLESHKKQGYIRNIFNARSATDSQASQKSGLSAYSASSTNQPQKSYAEGPLLQITAGDIYKNKLLLPTSASSLYQNQILNRHKIALNNQWWNGLLTEHTAETLFLSDIDWRYTFIQDYNSPELYQKQQQFFSKLRYNASSGDSALRQAPTSTLTSESSETFFGKVSETSNTKQKAHNRGAVIQQSQDVVIDFPDADQYYNPKQRRWFVTSGYWNSWFNVNQDLQTEVFDYLIFESIITSFNILNNNRELLDYAVSKFIKTGLIKETNYKILLKKFS